MAIALFDLDNTLINGDSDHLWGEYLCHIGVVDIKVYREQNDQFLKDYQAGELDIIAYNEFCLEPLSLHSVETLFQWRADFLEQIILPIVLNAGQEQVESHRNAGDDIVMITATNEFITGPIAGHMNFENLIATTPEMIDGKYSGNLSGEPCFQRGKVNRLNRWLEETGKKLDDSSFYSDSINDLPLLELVDRPIAVDPDERLLAHARKHGWEIMSFRESRKSSNE